MLLNMLAQTTADQEQAAKAVGMMAGVFGVVCCGMVLVGLAIQALICYFLSGFLKAIPPEHRKQEPNMVWLLMIPIFPLVWNWFVYPKTSESFQSYFASKGRTDVGDCGRQLAVVFCILVDCSIVPYLNFLTGLGALVLLIMLLVKFSEFKKQITA